MRLSAITDGISADLAATVEAAAALRAIAGDVGIELT